MSISADDLGIIGDLATAAGFLDASGDPDPGWFGAPHEALANILANETQRTALIDFIDEALGGAERESDTDGLVWLPAISVDDPEIDVFVTFDDRDVDAVVIGIGAVFRSSDPSTETTISVPLFLAAKEGRSIASPLHLGRRARG